MKGKLILLLTALMSLEAAAQVAMPGFSMTAIGGSSQFTGSGKFRHAGYSANFETTGLFCVTAGYQHLAGQQSHTVSNGTRHIRLTQNNFKFLVGYGLPLDLGDDAGLVISAQYGFLAGTDRLNVWHEYPNGTITYGMDKTSTGVYKALRVFPQVLNFRVTYVRGVTLFAGVEKVFRKKKDVFEFWDQNEIKYAYTNVWGGGGKQYYALNDTHGLSFFLGVGFVLNSDR